MSTTPETEKPKKKFGTFKGVFTPSALTIFGVIMYLRLGWVVGNVGLFQTLVIVILASAVTFLTALSIAATATNMKVAGGGAYYMISRSLGLEAGAAVGIPLFFAQALGISFYIAGFSESVHNITQLLPALGISIIAIVLVFGLAFKSADIALKSQFVILALIFASLVSFFLGQPLDEVTLAKIAIESPDATFWVAFAVFFPAVTGIEAGISMSGDLKNPAKSLPLGTISAVALGFVVYVAIPIFLASMVSNDNALKNSLVFQKVALYEPLILVGIWGATLSSALGAMLGAPRTLQALAKDGVLSSHLRGLGKGFGVNDNPRYATIVTLIIATSCLFLGDLNIIAPILSMFFLTSYGVLNFSAGIEGMIANPAWRPRFRTPWYVSLFGSVICFAIMFMINPGATILAMLVSFGVYYYMQRKNLRANFGDMRRGILLFLARYSIFKLAELPPNPRSWRPNLLVFSGSPTARWYLIELAEAITHGKGFMTVATILPKGSTAEDRILELKRSIHEYLDKRNVSALVAVSAAPSINAGVTAMVRTYGMGPLVPNTVLLGETEKEDNFEVFAEMIIRIYQAKKNIVIIREGRLKKSRRADRVIDVWWGRERENAGLSLALGYMLQNSRQWVGAELFLKSVATTDVDRDTAFELLHTFLRDGRVQAKAEVYVTEAKKEAVFNKIGEVSREADLVFMGMEPPKLERFLKEKSAYLTEYAAYYRDLLERTRDFPSTAIVLTAEDMKFSEIFH